MKLQDSDARQKILTDLDTNFFVEAGAGSGKTHCLVERMAQLVKIGKADIENIAALTFTRKAAAELKERFQIRMEALSKDPLLSAEHRRNVGLGLSNLEQIFLGTIHSFCSKILRERPIEAGVDPGFEEIDEAADIIYARDAWHSFIEKSHSSKDAALAFMHDFEISAADLEDIYRKFVHYPDVEIVTAEAERPDFYHVKESIVRFLGFFKKVLPEKMHEKGPDKLQEALKKAILYEDQGYLNQDRLLIKLLRELSKKMTVTQNRWPDGKGGEYLQKMVEFQENTLRAALDSWNAYSHRILADFAQKGALYYSEWRKAYSVLNFEDLLGLTSKLLKNNSEVRTYFKKRYTHILVDEFQDTDPIQAEMILFLTGSDVEEKDWKKIRPHPGSLFLVGDPKQSIYRFRRADIDIYNTVKNIFRDEQNQLLHLYSNFRSLPFMREVVQKVFQERFPASEQRYQAIYSPLETERTAKDCCDKGLFENNIERLAKNNASDVAALDSQKIAAWISYAVSGHLKLERTTEEIKSGMDQSARYADFLILTKKKANLCHYGRALEKLGIPYDISGSLAFSESDDLKEILKLFKAIEDEKDPVALVTALRGLFFGISDKELYDFKKAGGRFSYFSKVPEGFDSFGRAFERLKDYRKIVDGNRPIVSAEIMIEKTGLMPFVLSQEEGLSRAGNLYKAVELLKDAGMQTLETFYDFIKGLEQLLEKGEIESRGLLASKKNVVRIMNVHKAKGLEAPVVILADPLGESRQFEPSYHIDRTDQKESKGYFTITKMISNFGSQIIGIPPDWEEKCLQEKKYEEAEKIRLEYVAVTRAKNILVVSTYREGTRPKAWSVLYEHLSSSTKLSLPAGQRLQEKEVLDLSRQDWEKEKEQSANKIASLAIPTYDYTTVTSEAKEGLAGTGFAGIGKGAKWGSICHRAIESVLRANHEKIEALAGRWIEEEGFSEANKEVLMELVERFIQSPLLKRVQRSAQKYFEAPFAFACDGHIIQGVIDLVFKEEKGWVIVDYKTDDFEKDADRKMKYQKQLQLYKQAWETISGQKVAETILYKL
jgi:ATP-dependent helicase/nuclease subunit A